MNPLLRILALLARLTRAACPWPCSLNLLDAWTHEAIDERNAAATAALAIDDPLERAHALVDIALRNDPPRLRRQVLDAIAEVHRRTEAQAANLRIQIPLALEQ